MLPINNDNKLLVNIKLTGILLFHFNYDKKYEIIRFCLN